MKRIAVSFVLVAILAMGIIASAAAAGGYPFAQGRYWERTVW